MSEKPNRMDRFPIGLVLAGVFSIVPALLMPVVVGSLIKGLGFSLAQAGRITSLEFTGALIGSVIILFLIKRVNRRLLAAVAAGLWVTMGLLSAMTEDFQTLMALRILSGCGMGAMVSIVTAIIAGQAQPVRLFAVMTIGLPIAGFIFLPLLQTIVSTYDSAGAYFFLAGLASAVFILSFTLPISVPAQSKGMGEESKDRPNLFLWIATLASFLFFFVAIGAVWNYSERIGSQMGMSEESVGWLLGITQLALAGGSMTAALLNERMGNILPMATGMLLLIAGNIVIASADSSASYGVGLCLFTFGWTFAQPYLIGVCARLDPAGQLATAASSMQNVGLAAGPALTVALVTDTAINKAGFLAATTVFLALIIILPVLTKLRSLSQSSAADQLQANG